MKPAVDVSQKSPVVAVTEPIVVESKPAKRTWPMYVGGGLLGVFLGIGMAVLLITFLQARDNQHDMKMKADGILSDLTAGIVKADVTYHLPQTEKTLEETLVVTDKEEEIITKDARMIFDYENGVVVTLMSRSDGTSTESVCFVRAFNPTKGISRIRDILRKGKKEAFVTKDIQQEVYVPSSENFDMTLLSERAAAMCENSRVVLMERAGGIAKRGVYGTTPRPPARPPVTSCFSENVRGFGCNFYCQPRSFDWPVRECGANDRPTRGDVTVRSQCVYQMKNFEENICILQCNCLGGDVWEGSGEV